MNVTFNDDYGDSDLVVLNNTCRKNYQDIFAIYQATKLQLTAKIAELNNTIFKVPLAALGVSMGNIFLFCMLTHLIPGILDNHGCSYVT